MIPSDLGSQFSSLDWQGFLRANNLISSRSRRGDCHDNTGAEAFPVAEAGMHSTELTAPAKKLVAMCSMRWRCFLNPIPAQRRFAAISSGV